MQLQNILGKRITHARLAKPSEMNKCGWNGEEPPVVFVLENGYILVPAADAKMNEPGQVVILDALTGELASLSGTEASHVHGC